MNNNKKIQSQSQSQSKKQNKPRKNETDSDSERSIIDLIEDQPPRKADLVGNIVRKYNESRSNTKKILTQGKELQAILK